MEKETIHVILTRNAQELNFYFDELFTRVRESGYLFTSNKRDRIKQGEDVYVFVTPDDATKMMGMRIHDFEAKGTAYEHSRYHDAVELLETRIV